MALLLIGLLLVGCGRPTATDGSGNEAEAYLLAKIDRFDDIVRSRWPVETHTILAADYRSGFADNYDAIVVVSEIADTAPESLLADILQPADREVVWIGWHSSTVLSTLGITGSPYKVGAHAEVHYEGLDLSGEGMVVTDPIEPASQAGLAVLASLRRDEANTPLIVEFEERVLVMPFELPDFYYRVDSYGSVFLDLLDRSLGPTRSAEKLALVRLEDVNPYTYSEAGGFLDFLRKVYGFLDEQGIPFNIALIARYVDPGERIDTNLAESDDFMALLEEMLDSGRVSLVQHGYTHQVEGVSGDDWEFWDEKRDDPLEDDSSAWVVSRIMGSQKAMIDAGLDVPRIWETPHYTESALDSEVINSFYAYRYDPSPLGGFPFPLQLDDVTYIPENLGYIEDLETDLQAMAAKLDALSLLDGAVASFFWHPYRDIGELKAVVSLIRSKGFRFATVEEVLSGLAEARGFPAAADEGAKRVLIVGL